jgi:hypothetical protein
MDAFILSAVAVCILYALFTLAWVWFSDED